MSKDGLSSGTRGGTVVYQLSDAADFVTGQLLPVNGGYVLN